MKKLFLTVAIALTFAACKKEQTEAPNLKATTLEKHGADDNPTKTAQDDKNKKNENETGKHGADDGANHQRHGADDGANHH